VLDEGKAVLVGAIDVGKAVLVGAVDVGKVVSVEVGSTGVLDGFGVFVEEGNAVLVGVEVGIIGVFVGTGVAMDERLTISPSRDTYIPVLWVKVSVCVPSAKLFEVHCSCFCSEVVLWFMVPTTFPSIRTSIVPNLFGYPR
jgi:hypothetical protein